MSKYTITLKKIKLIKSRSEETHCFTANIYVNGVALCEADNDGRGGCDRYTPLNKGENQNDVYKRIKEINDELGKEKIQCSTFELPNSLDLIVGDLLNTHLFETEVKNLLRRRICYTTTEGGLYQLPARFKPTVDNINGVVKADWWVSSNTLLRDMSMEDAVKLLKE